MELRLLEYFLAVVREENITRAAEILHVTQPTLSRQMAQLEEELGVELFTRGRHLKLTDAGILLRRRAEEVTSLIGKTIQELEEQAEPEGTISIGSGGLISSQNLPAAMEAFRKQHPRIQYHFYTNSADYVKELLEQGLLDFGFLLEPIDVTKFDYLRMKEKERWGLLMNAGHYLAGKEHICKEDLLHIPLITTDRLLVQRELEQWLGKPLSDLEIFATYNIVTHAAMLVESGAAAALTIEGAVNLFEESRLVFRPLYPELSMSSVLAWKKFQPESSAAWKFLEYFKSIQ